MTQTTAPSRPQAEETANSPLFDLLGRSWPLGAPVASVAMDRAGRCAVFALADGRLAVVPLDDPESPVARLRVEADTGRDTIRPRQKPPAPPVLTGPLSDTAPMIAPSAGFGVFALTQAGTLNRVTPKGQLVRLKRFTCPVTAFASDGAGRLAIATDGRVDLHAEDTLVKTGSLLTAGQAGAVGLSPDGRGIAVLQQDGLVLWSPGERSEKLPPTGTGPIVFSPSGQWLAVSNGNNGFWLVRCTDGRHRQIGNFPAAPGAPAFGANDATVFVPGAFRVAGWSLATPPLDHEADGALRTGRPGVVIVARIATHPTRDLVAFGTENGAVAIARAGHPDEMMLRHADGAPVTALAWSRCGLHLAIGTAEGAAAILTLPPQLFK